MAVSKVILNGVTLMDVTQDTVAEGNLLKSETATRNDGEQIEGDVVVPPLSDATPQDLGTAAAGSSSEASRADHVHGMPSAADVGAIPAPSSATKDYVLGYDGSKWVADKRTFIAKYGSSTYAEVLSAYEANKIMYCRASSNASNPGTGNQLRLAFLAYVNNETTPTEFEFQYYRSVATHSATQQGDQVFVYKLKQNTGWEFSVREAYTKIDVGTGLTTSYSNGVLTISLA